MVVNPAKHAVTVAIALTLVIGLIYALAFVARKFKNTQLINKDLKIEAIMHLNNKVKLMIVNVAAQRILLGVTADAVNNLATLTSFKQISEQQDDCKQCSKDSC